MRRTNIISAVMITFLTGIMIPVSAIGQNTYVVSDASTLTINGSANVTDWDANATIIKGEVVLDMPEDINWQNADASWFKKVSISIPVKDLQSDSGKMSSNIHKYLKEKAHPVITYELDEALLLIAHSNPGITLTAKGVVTAAGVPFEIEHDVIIKSGNNGQLIISGNKELNMTDFNIDPPTAMLGTVRAHDKMNISFELVLEAR